jgi:hypothetical protein
MINYNHDIMIDLTYSDLGFKFKPLYYVNAVKDCIDSMNEGSSCDNIRIYPKIYIYMDENKLTCSHSYFHYANDIFNEITKRNIHYTSIEIKVKNYEKIFNEAKKYRNIILGTNIITYFAIKNNINDIEDMNIICFQFGPINLNEINPYYLNKLSIFKDGGNFYIDNPLIQDFYIVYTDLNYIQ